MEVVEMGMKQKTKEKGRMWNVEGGDGGETDDDREGMNADVGEMGVKQKTIEKGSMWMWRR